MKDAVKKKYNEHFGSKGKSADQRVLHRHLMKMPTGAIVVLLTSLVHGSACLSNPLAMTLMLRRKVGLPPHPLILLFKRRRYLLVR